MTDKDYLNQLRMPSENDPLRILTSACLVGVLCGADGTSYGHYPNVIDITKYKNVKITSFCPEDFAFGTPREIPDLEGGNGADVLDGKAKVIDESGRDVTEKMMLGANKMLQVARDNKIELAIMMDVSAACGSQVIYKGHRLSREPAYQIGMGVSAQLLQRHGFKIVSQRDFASLEILLSKLDPKHQVNKAAIDHDQTEWYQTYFKSSL